jgi:hypothetical protein
MTQHFRRTARCKKCGSSIALEDDFSQWVRSCAELKSGDGFAFMDKDLVVHRFRTTHGREFQCFMCVEVKTLNASLTDSQRDTIHMQNQLFRNRRATPTKRIPKQISGLPDRIYSTLLKRNVGYKAFGYHLLRISGTHPDNSDEIRWDDRHFITVNALVRLFRFELDPDTLQPMDWRRHHADPYSGTTDLFDH